MATYVSINVCINNYFDLGVTPDWERGPLSPISDPIGSPEPGIIKPGSSCKAPFKSFEPFSP